MTTISATDARAVLYRLIDEVRASHEPVLITGKRGNAVLLANHGLVAVGIDLASAFACAEEIELVARIYYQARCAGTPQLIDDAEMDRVIDKFKSYGK